jgi:hypothetical protein
MLAVTESPLQAQNFDRKTTLTFNTPVRLPGKVTLPAGTYVFRLHDSNAERHVVRITNPRGNQTFATVLAINDYRPTATTKSVMTFGESASCQPHTIKAWYYAGDTNGSRFVYSKEEAEALAKGCQEPVPHVEPAVLTNLHAEPVAERIVAVPMYVATPSAPTVEYAMARPHESDADDSAGFDADPEPAPAATPAMPRTNSQLPLLGLMGMILLVLSLGGRLALRRLN